LAWHAGFRATIRAIAAITFWCVGVSVCRVLLLLCRWPRLDSANRSELSEILFGIRCISYYRLTPGVRFSVNPDMYDSKPVPFGPDHQAVETRAMTQPDCIEVCLYAFVKLLFACGNSSPRTVVRFVMFKSLCIAVRTCAEI